MRKRHLVLAGFISLLVFSLLLAPASLLRYFVADNAGIKLGRLSGTLWNGHANSLNIQQHRLDDINWSFKPSHLFLGRIALDLEARYQQQPVSTIAAVSLDQALYLDDTQANIPASLLADQLALPMGELDGQVQVALEKVRLAQQQVPLVNGQINWQQASITVADTARLGNVSITLDGYDAGVLNAVLQNQGGDLRLNGEGKVAENGDYDLQLDLVAGNSASNNVKNSLRMFAKPQPGGGYRVDNQGNIFKLPL